MATKSSLHKYTNKPNGLGVIMGILNITPDSFADGGVYNTVDKATIHAQKMVSDGASIIDVGGESSRPNAQQISLDEELSRVIPVINNIKNNINCQISIDTTKVEVMRQAVAAGASMVNDISALSAKDAMVSVAKLGVEVCLMHMQGKPKTMQDNPHYINIVAEIVDFFNKKIAACIKAGISKDKLIIDPGFGFGKSYKHNIILLNNLAKLKDLSLPILVGLSRKSMLNIALGGNTQPTDRITASVIAATIALKNGANIFRVHDVKQTRDAFKIINNFGDEPYSSPKFL